MTDTRNPKDRLYDIPFEHSAFQEPNYELAILYPIYQASLAKKKEEKKKTPKQISFTPTRKITVNNMTIMKFNNIVQPFINNNSTPFLPVKLVNEKLNVIIRKGKTKADLVSFLHGALCSPTSLTWIQAVNNNHFATWPGLSSSLVAKHLPPYIATAEGHIKQERKNLQSTQPKQVQVDHDTIIQNLFNDPTLKKVSLTTSPKQTISPPAINAEDDAFLASAKPNVKTQQVVYFLSTADSLGLAYSDLTGKFPVQSSRGNNYLLVGYHQDANAILVEPLINRQAQTIVTAWSTLNACFKLSGMKPSTWVMDNKCSSDLKSALNKEEIHWQLVPPHNHRANAAERAIQTLNITLKLVLQPLIPTFQCESGVVF